MATKGSDLILRRRFVGASLGSCVLLDAVESTGDEGQRRVSLFFGNGSNPGKIELPGPWTRAASGRIGGARWLQVETATRDTLELSIAGQTIQVTPARTELGILEGRNAALAERNGESAETVLNWLEFHSTQQAMTGAVILDRSEPGTDASFFRSLELGLGQASFNCRVVIITSDLPLGRPDLPPEAHPFCAPGAPGKDRMEVPAAAPWSSPLAASLFYEIARVRFLTDARAVANIDVHDLMVRNAENVFDRAVASNGGLVTLSGRQSYPWRVRQGEPVGFADHICLQFDSDLSLKRWCIAPAKAPRTAVWRQTRIDNADTDASGDGRFFRCMGLRHTTGSVSRIVPKTSLVEHPELLELSQKTFGHNPVRMPEMKLDDVPEGRGRRAILTTMKNEGPFILEWIAYHRAIGFDDFLIYTNDCTDGTDTMLELLQSKGFVQHRDNPFRELDLKPQHAALQAAKSERIIERAKWVACIDVDEYVNVRCGSGTLDDLFTAVPDANMISMTWRLFGNADVHAFRDEFIVEQFNRCAPEYIRKPHQAWGFKTIFQNVGIFRKIGVHRPKGLNSQLVDQINWVNGSGEPLPKEHFRNAWRSTTETYGYDLVSLNHYAVRSAESFLVKRDRGRVNHVDRDQGRAYWFRMNNNAEEDHSIRRMLPVLRAEFDALMADPEIAAMHAKCVAKHRSKIEELRATSNHADFYSSLTSARLEKLSHLHAHFGANVFLAGPDVIPDDVVNRDPEEQFFFTVEKGATNH